MLLSLLFRRCAHGAMLLLLAACATSPPLPQRPGVFTAPGPGGTTAPQPGAQPPVPGATPGSPGAPATPAAPAATPLTAEQRFFESWFGGTPVVIAAQAPTTLQLDVPLNFSFDPGKAEVKPALNKVLDRVAESLRRQAGARIVIAAPPDGRGASSLAQARAQSVRDNLTGKAVPITRVTLADAPLAAGTAVQLRMTIPTASSAAPIAHRSEGDGPTVITVKPVSTTRPGWTEKKQ